MEPLRAGEMVQSAKTLVVQAGGLEFTFPATEKLGMAKHTCNFSARGRGRNGGQTGRRINNTCRMTGTSQKPMNERLHGRLLCLKEIRLRVMEQDTDIPLRPLSGAQPYLGMCVNRTCTNIVVGSKHYHAI